MQLHLQRATVYEKGMLFERDVVFSQGQFFDASIFHSSALSQMVQLPNRLVIPGFVDVHVHLREPGFFYKESIASGTQAAAHGGYTTVCAMPNLAPPPDTKAHVLEQLALIERDAVVRVLPYGCITMGQKGEGELCDYEALLPDVVAFSDDGRGVQDEGLMREAMRRVKALNGMIVAHCEDNALLKGGVIHAGVYAQRHHHKGILSESEWGQVARDLRLAKETGCRYHVCHVSTKESVALIRNAKREGVDVTCETAPHYLLLDENDLQEDGRFKMNPPLRAREDRMALVEGLLDGTVDIIATDHAPHSMEEKARGLDSSAFGVVGLECAFPVLYEGLVKKGIVPLEAVLKAMVDAPRERFGLGSARVLGQEHVDAAVINLNAQGVVDSNAFLSKGRATPFAGMQVSGEVEYTWVGGNAVWQKN